VEPTNPLEAVRRLAADEGRCVFFRPVLEELRTQGMDSDDLREIIRSELGSSNCYRSKVTEKYYPGTVSDYYSIWVDDCGLHMFLKMLISGLGSEDERLVVTSFKEDNRYEC
jgi:hypothetical protein